MTIKVKISENGQKCIDAGVDIMPTRGTQYSAGMDLRAAILEPIVIPPRSNGQPPVKIYTGLHIYLGTMENSPLQHCAFYLPRSSNNNIVLANTVGLLDADFQGESFLKIYNGGCEEITINPGDVLAQLVIVPTLVDAWHFVEDFDTVTERGEGGDGSTGNVTGN